MNSKLYLKIVLALILLSLIIALTSTKIRTHAQKVMPAIILLKDPFGRRIKVLDTKILDTGEIVLCGQVGGEGFVCKLSARGVPEWGYLLKGSKRVMSLAISKGVVVAGGIAKPTKRLYEDLCFVVAFDLKTGNMKWLYLFGPTHWLDGLNYTSIKVKTLKNGNIIVVGSDELQYLHVIGEITPEGKGMGGLIFVLKVPLIPVEHITSIDDILHIDDKIIVLGNIKYAGQYKHGYIFTFRYPKLKPIWYHALKGLNHTTQFNKILYVNGKIIISGWLERWLPLPGRIVGVDTYILVVEIDPNGNIVKGNAVGEVPFPEHVGYCYAYNRSIVITPYSDYMVILALLDKDYSIQEGYFIHSEPYKRVNVYGTDTIGIFPAFWGYLGDYGLIMIVPPVFELTVPFKDLGITIVSEKVSREKEPKAFRVYKDGIFKLRKVSLKIETTPSMPFEPMEVNVPRLQPYAPIVYVKRLLYMVKAYTPKKECYVFEPIPINIELTGYLGKVRVYANNTLIGEFYVKGHVSKIVKAKSSTVGVVKFIVKAISEAYGEIYSSILKVTVKPRPVNFKVEYPTKVSIGEKFKVKIEIYDKLNGSLIKIPFDISINGKTYGRGVSPTEIELKFEKVGVYKIKLTPADPRYIGEYEFKIEVLMPEVLPPEWTVRIIPPAPPIRVGDEIKVRVKVEPPAPGVGEIVFIDPEGNIKFRRKISIGKNGTCEITFVFDKEGPWTIETSITVKGRKLKASKKVNVLPKKAKPPIPPYIKVRPKLRDFALAILAGILIGVFLSYMFRGVAEVEEPPPEYWTTYTIRDVIALVAGVVVYLVAFSYVAYGGLRKAILSLENILTLIAISLIIVTVDFISEALASKARGFWAEYSPWIPGIIAILITSILFKIPFACPNITLYSRRYPPSERARTGLLKTPIMLGAVTVLLGLGLIGLDTVIRLATLILLAILVFTLFPIEPLLGYYMIRGSILPWAIDFSFAISLYVIEALSLLTLKITLIISAVFLAVSTMIAIPYLKYSQY